jgi:urease accessory protein
MHSDSRIKILTWISLILSLAPSLARAHIAQGDVSGGFIAGFEHPISGLDHVVAMVAVGLWGAQLGQPAIWVLPVTFPLVMAFGGVLGGLGLPIPGIEIGIALSAITLGSMVASAAKPSLWIAGTIVAIFAIFHGYAHGEELPKFANPISYAAGFVIATGSLHVIGIAIGTINRWKSGAWILRSGGIGIALIGAFFFVAALGKS